MIASNVRRTRPVVKKSSVLRTRAAAVLSGVHRTSPGKSKKRYEPESRRHGLPNYASKQLVPTLILCGRAPRPVCKEAPVSPPRSGALSRGHGFLVPQDEEVPHAMLSGIASESLGLVRRDCASSNGVFRRISLRDGALQRQGLREVSHLDRPVPPGLIQS